MQIYVDRFWTKVNKNGPVHPVHGRCWEWKAGKFSTGYGQFKVKYPISAHRFSYTVNVGIIPKGVCVLHKCDNPICVNPKHLFLGTHQDNIRDRDSKGRQAFGSKNGTKTHPEKVVHGEKTNTAKLTEQQVLQIRRKYALRPKGSRLAPNSQSKLAREFGVCQTTISSLLRKKSWKHL